MLCMNSCSTALWHLAQVAGTLNLKMEDSGIGGGTDFVRAVAVGADRSPGGSGGDGASVHAFLIGVEGLGAVAGALHDKFQPVTGGAGRRDIDVVHRRLGIGGGEDLVRVAVTGQASGGLLVAVFAGGGVDTELVSADGVGMAAGALLGHDLLGALDFMRRAVTTGAGRGSEQAVRTLGHLAQPGSAWQVAQDGLRIGLGWGYSFTPTWQVVQPRAPCTLLLCLPASTCRLRPDSDFMPGSPWQARQS